METNSVVFFRSKDYPPLPAFPIVSAWNIKSPENVGSLMRLIDNAGGKELFLLDDEIPKRISSVRKTAGLSFANISLVAVSSESFFDTLAEGYSVVAIETSEDSKNLFEVELPQKVVLLLGSESHGLPVELLNKCHQIVHIPMTGKCKSMNVSHALAVALFEWQRQQLFNNKCR